MQKLNKKIIIIIAVIILVLGISAGTIYFLSKNNTIKQADSALKISADSLKSKALDAIRNNDTRKAKTLLEQAQTKYNEINTTDTKTTDQVDVEALLWQVDHKNSSSVTQ